MNTLTEVILIVAIVSLLAVVLMRAIVSYRNRSHIKRGHILMDNAANQPGCGESLTGYRTFLATSVTGWTTFASTYTNAVQPPGRFALVKLDTANANQILISSADTDKIIGVATDVPTAALDPVNVRLLSAAGTTRMVAAGAISIGDTVCSNGDGAIKTWTTGSRYPIGIALMAAGAAGDIIEVMTDVAGVSA